MASLLKHISFSSQTSSQRAHWNEQDDGSCIHCQQEDSRTHRLLECPVGSEIRAPFQPRIDAYHEHGSTQAEFSVVLQHPLQSAYQDLLFQYPLATFSDAVLSFVATARQQRSRVLWFTDGSSKFPCSPHTTYGAYAVVLDLCTSDEQRVAYSNTWTGPTHDMPCFACVAAARNQGEQDILRSELQAVACVITRAAYGELFVDNQATIDMVTTTLRAATWQELTSFEHCDILVQIWHAREGVDVTFHKIKSHVTNVDQMPSLSRYYQWGNDYADLKAKEACNTFEEPFVNELQEVHDQQQAAQTHLSTVLELHLALLPLRVEAAKQLQSRHSIQHTADDILQAFVNWQVEDGRCYPLAPPGPELQHCAWGAHSANGVLGWRSKLVWPPQGDYGGPMGQHCGISWIELAVSYILDQDDYLPIHRPGPHGDKMVLQIHTPAHAQEFAATIAEQAESLRLLVDNVAALQPNFVWPPQLQRRKIASLYIQGHGHYRQGLLCRPVIPKQKEVAELLQQKFGQETRKLDWIPTTSNSLAFTTLCGSWTDRTRHAKNRMRYVRIGRALS
eukprot:Skav201139  [mRNA]  locus=scaffold4217:177303:178988:- [translate_table: standard]